MRETFRLAVLRQFTSALAHTGSNLSLNPRSGPERRACLATAPGWMRQLRPLILMHHRVRRLLGGSYFQPSFSYSLYTCQSTRQRVTHHVNRPTFRWRW